MIRKVNLSHNKLKEIRENTFASQTIDLSHNLIDLIRESAFKVDDVLNINLDGNNLNSNSIQAGFIKSFNKKGYSDLSLNLHLNYNQLTHLDYHVFSPLLQSPHTTIALANNPLKCDCRVKWILEAKRYDSTWSTVYPRIDSATCADGSDLVKEFYSKELNSCGKSMTAMKFWSFTSPLSFSFISLSFTFIYFHFLSSLYLLLSFSLHLLFSFSFLNLILSCIS